MLKGDQSFIVDLSKCKCINISLLQCFSGLEIGTKTKLRALSLCSLAFDSQFLFQEINQIRSLAVLNIQGITGKSKIKLAELESETLQFINISNIELTDFDLRFEGLQNLTEIVGHSNSIKTLHAFQNLQFLQLLDLENNDIADSSVALSNLKVLNLKGNPLQKLEEVPQKIILNPLC